MTEIADYYTSNRPGRKVLEFLERRFGDGKAPDVNDLAAVDSFHLRGRAATESLATSVDLKSGIAVLDVGSGPGGTARYLADRFGVSVTGLDLTFDFTRLADLLSGKLGLSGSTHFTCASALDMPFASSSFHGAWMEHVQMNIPDKARLAAEIHRILKPSGFLALYEVFQTGNRPPDYPLPWAEDPSCSMLTQPETMQHHLEKAGFKIERWHDCLEDTRLWIEKRSGRPPAPSRPVSDVRLLMGGQGTRKTRNLVTAVLDKRLAVIEAVCRKP